MSELNERIANYTYRLNPDRIRDALVVKKPAMVAGMRERITELYQIEQAVKAVLASEPTVTAIQVFFYHACAREIYGKQRTYSGGEQLLHDVALILAKWQGRGLAEPVLIRIRNEVFSIPAP